MKNLLRLIKTYHFDYWRLVEIITSTIAIVAFLFGAHFFTSKAGLKVENEMLFSPGISLQLISEFYVANDKDIPSALKQFFPEQGFLDDSNIVTSTSPEIYTLKSIDHLSKVDGFFKEKISKLESVLGTYDFKSTIAGTGYMFDGYVAIKDFKNLLKEAKKVLTEKDYYIFLIAGLNSHCIHNNVQIRNVGDIDLKNIKVYIYSPESRVTGKRDRNIIKTLFASKILHEIRNDIDGITIQIPMLKRNKSFFLTVVSKENQINTDEIFYSYQNDYVIDKAKLIWIFLGLFMLMLIFCDVFRSRITKT